MLCKVSVFLSFQVPESPGGLEVDGNRPHAPQCGLISQRSRSEIVTQNRQELESGDLGKCRAAINVVQGKQVLPRSSHNTHAIHSTVLKCTIQGFLYILYFQEAEHSSPLPSSRTLHLPKKKSHTCQQSRPVFLSSEPWNFV